MNALTILRYLIGDAAAIRRIAYSRVAPVVGLLLVISAGAARNYDQVSFIASLNWITGPLMFSIVSGFWVFVFVWDAWKGLFLTGRTGWLTAGRRIASFFGLFWMTAPIAWLYAIPVERWFDPLRAAQWNVALLTVVSFWRVLLLSRAVSVVGEMPYFRALGRVLVPASVEVLALSFHVGIGRQIMSSMGGLRNSPAEDVMLGAMDVAIKLALAMLVAGALMGFAGGGLKAGSAATRTLNAGNHPKKVPYLFLCLTGLFWWWVSFRPQQELRLSGEANRLAGEQDWNGLVSFLSMHRKDEFAPSVVLPPSPWERSGVSSMPSVLKALTPETPRWIREMYFASLDFVLSQPDAVHHILEAEDLVEILLAAEKLPEGPALIARHAKVFDKLQGDWVTKNGTRFDLAEKVKSVISGAEP